ncbi:outer membrane beta-barrel protein [Legionella sp. W05-934-2]|jgi:hypothetical protein|uniref:outer membrane beta-barrel protein n=1 Tax=Legionella sp. W05-934-2 TaxID=1198649 RepID=UPI003461D338
MMQKLVFILLIFLGIQGPINAKDARTSENHRFYFGVLGGAGSTTWRGLVPNLENQNMALSISTPIEAKEGGAVWGGFVDYELSPYFAMEANYIRFPNATVTFDPWSLFAFNNHGQTQLTTKTDTLSVLAKVMMKIANSNWRLYSGAGVSRLHRRDFVVDKSSYSPTFIVGMNTPIHPHFLAEISGQYTAGYGESNLNPSDTYMPFLYAIMVKLAYVV